MEASFDAASQKRLETYLDEIGCALGDARRRASFATYFLGLLSDGERKSVEPIAARACGEPGDTERAHDRILHLLTDSPWDDRAVRRIAARHALSAMTSRDPILSWIIDDTGFLKQGKHSVGVQRQYSGSAGKTANCQIGVSLSIATRTEHLPIDFELYLPKVWVETPERRKEAHIPDDLVFRTKPELALVMIEKAVADGIPLGVVLADSAYGNVSEFRSELRRLKLQYAVGVHSNTHVWQLDSSGRRRGDALSLKALAIELGREKFRSVTWRDSTRGPLRSRFARLRVLPAHDDRNAPSKREDVWLLIEWPDGEPEPTDYVLSSLPRQVAKSKLIRIYKERYRTERVYEDLKGELGLDHYEWSPIPRLASSHIRGSLLRCVRDGRKDSVFPPLGSTALSYQPEPSPGLSAISQTHLSRLAWPSLALSPTGCRAAPFATAQVSADDATLRGQAAAT